ncbi:MAG: nucleoside:proton symporter [Leptospiraceae bacterium]|nr:nucleoside:proton symporter [Leptospiraceae bacterium]
MNILLDASEEGARFVFGDKLVPRKVTLKCELNPNSTELTNCFGNDPVAFVKGNNAMYVEGPLIPEKTVVVSVDPGKGNITLNQPVTIKSKTVSPVTFNAVFYGSSYPLGYIFAFRALPMVIFFSALISLLYRLNLIQPVVKVFAVLFQKTMRISGAESLSGAANIFVGIESAIAIKPYLAGMTRSELCAILASCFGSIASTVLGVYVAALRRNFPSITGHLMAASVLTIPACFVLAKIIIPEDGKPLTMGGIPEEKDDGTPKPGYMDSFIKGAIDGVGMAVGISAVLIGMLAVVEVLKVVMNGIVGIFYSGALKYSVLHYIFGAIFFPFTFLTGISFNLSEVWEASVLIGQRFFLNAIPSYNALPAMNNANIISDRTMLITSYVLCGFASLSSVGIFVGGLTNLIPDRVKDISSVTWKALFAATLATFMTGCIAGLYEFGNPGLLGK